MKNSVPANVSFEGACVAVSVGWEDKTFHTPAAQEVAAV
jgi:hypothetical protein